MKKRILALALAGTTAFSVFGAAVTADAASSHVVFGNDPYTSYKSAEVTFSNTDTYVNSVTGKALEKDDLGALTYETVNEAAKTELGNIRLALGYEWLSDTTTPVYKHSLQYTYETAITPYKEFFSTSNTPLTIAGTKDTVTGAGTVADLGESAYIKPADKYTQNDGMIYLQSAVITEAENAIKTNKNYTALAEDIKGLYNLSKAGSVTVNPQYAYKYNYAYGEGKLVTDELAREGTTVENGNVYAYDYFTVDSGVMALSQTWDAATFVRNYDKKTLVNSKDATNLIAILDNIDTDDNYSINDNFAKGRGGYYDARTSVVEEYEDFLVEIGVLRYAWNGTGNLVPGVSKKDFLESYSYKYNNNIDDYNFEGLVDDLYKTIGGQYNNNYETMSSSNLVYLMQQYDKYVDGSYIDENEVDESEWANLLMECLNAVTADDFTTASAYNSFSRAAEFAISRYENAATPAQQTDAIEGLYDRVVATYGRASTSDKTELVNSLNSLYFNNKNIPDVYMTKVAENGNDTNADLVLYGYGVAQDVIDASIKTTQSTIKAVYPLYPVADYYQKDRKGAEYAGIKAGTVPDDVTAEYEWFANVYQLATEINGKATPASYQGMIDTVNDALNSAVEALAPTKTPAGSTTLRLEEAVEKYADKIDTDYLTKYYDAYTKANDYAGVVEGNTQTKYAIEMVIVSGETLGYQGAQNTVTKGMISELKTAIKNANTALTALKNDEDNYNAAQVNALNKAIATADALVSDYDGNASTKVNGVPTKTAGDKDNFVISDVNKAIEAIDAAINFKEVLQGWHEFDEGWKYGYIKEDGTAAYVESGWYKVGASWFYFRDSIALENEWIKEDGKWYYLNSNCAAAYGWAKVDGKWYYFNGDNSMRTGWVKTGGHWYYLNAGGAMVTGWAQIDGKWYYFSKTENAIGQMLANTTTPDGCKVDENGVWVK